MSQGLCKFTPGQYFKLKPNARITYLAFSNQGGSCIGAVPMNTDIGQKLHAWLFAGGDKANKPCSYEDVCKVMKEFWPHDLEQAELA